MGPKDLVALHRSLEWQNDLLRRFDTPVFLKLQNEVTKTVAELSAHLNAFNQSESILRSVAGIGSYDYTATHEAIRQFVEDTQRVQKLVPTLFGDDSLRSFAQLTQSTSIFAEQTRETIRELTAGIDKLRLDTLSGLSAAHYSSLTAHSTLASLPWERLGQRFGLPLAGQERLARSSVKLASRYSRMLKREQDASRIPADAPTGLLAHSQALRVITIDESESPIVRVQTELVQVTLDFVTRELEAVNPSWAQCVAGARERLVKRGHDWPRHWATSYRHVLKAVLHHAAPSETVKSWPTGKLEFDSRGFPTRLTKVRWLCRNEEPANYRQYREQEIAAALQFIGMLDETVHEDSIEISENDIGWLSLFVERALENMLRLWQR
jgi:hypothetical protein